MRRWFIVSAIGRDRPGLVADLAQLVFDCDGNLEDSRMTILGTDFAVILLASTGGDDAADRLAHGAKQIERDHGLTILIRQLDGGPRSQIPAPGFALYRVHAAGTDHAGIVAGICKTLAEHGVNIAELSSQSRPGEGGAPHYELRILAEVPASLPLAKLRAALDREADRQVIGVEIEPA